MKIYDSPYSEIMYEESNRLLLFFWNESSKSLSEDDVKSEISKILDYLKQHPVSNIIVDARNYFFRENQNIQNWINYTFMPLIMDNDIIKYALVVSSKANQQEDSEIDFILPKVEYFTSIDAAKEWVAQV